MQHLCDDLEAEHAELDRLVADLSEQQWSRETPAAGWMIRDQISHLWYFDRKALLALTDADGFMADRQKMFADGIDGSIEPGRSMTGTELLHRWRTDRRRLSEVARSVDPAARIPWYGPAMAAKSFISARLMETWAHGVDVADTLGAPPSVSSRLRHVAHLGIRARPYAYLVNGRELPDHEVFVDLVGPEGDRWTWGDPTDALHRVEGAAIEFCLVVTQRRHVADTALQVDGEAARDWMDIAQAFAGPAGSGRAPGQFPR
jgi:uncharacterized protein (TIGR03084 family)